MSSRKTSCWMISVADHRLWQQGQGLWALFLSVLLLAGCSQDQRIHTLSGQTMGTGWSVKVVGMPAGLTLPALQQDIQLLLASINRQMSTYDPDSEISRFNAGAAGSWHALSPDFQAVLSQALMLARQTGGAFDPTVGPLVNVWGFGPSPMSLTVPGQAVLDAARARVGYQQLQRDDSEAQLLQRGGVYLDLSAIAKGHAVDRVADFLALRGFHSYLVEIGGELRAAGKKPGGEPWRIAVEQPVPGLRDVATVVSLSDMALATSGDYRNFYEVDGQRFAHIIDPRTGMPVSHGVASVTVVHARCGMADGLATALTVLGEQEGLAFAETLGLAVLFLVRDGDRFREVSSSAYQAFTASVTEVHDD